MERKTEKRGGEWHWDIRAQEEGQSGRRGLGLDILKTFLAALSPELHLIPLSGKQFKTHSAGKETESKEAEDCVHVYVTNKSLGLTYSQGRDLFEENMVPSIVFPLRP